MELVLFTFLPFIPHPVVFLVYRIVTPSVKNSFQGIIAFGKAAFIIGLDDPKIENIPEFGHFHGILPLNQVKKPLVFFTAVLPEDFFQLPEIANHLAVCYHFWA